MGKDKIGPKANSGTVMALKQIKITADRTKRLLPFTKIINKPRIKIGARKKGYLLNSLKPGRSLG